ncbi:MAG: 50S ribosomal protein L7ae [Lachnospiraceae bacterium]|nr:50S ribosomal protein L7ae [Lachnospiraceae bacterium]
MRQNKVYSALGLATRAGKTESGEFATEKAVKSGKASLAVVAEDASENTKKMFANMCAYYKVPYIIYGTKGELGHAIGKEYRASLAVTDAGFAKMIRQQLPSEEIGGNEEV